MSCNVPKNLKCPKCESLKVIGIGGTYTQKELNKAVKDLLNELRPLEKYECENCGYTWENPLYEKYVATIAGLF